MGKFENMRRRLLLTCRDVNAFLTAYAEGDLDEGTRKRFEFHVSHCLACAMYLEQYQQTVRIVNEAGRSDVPEPPEKLVELTLDFLREHYDEDRPSAG